MAERQTVQKQGRDDHIKQSSIQTPYISFFDIRVLWKKILVGGLYTYLFYVIIPPLFLYILPFCYPYILLHFKCFLLFMSFFSSLSTCLSWGLPSHSNRSLSQAATDIWTIDSGISYTDSIGWRITGPSVLSQPFSGWMTKPALPGTHRWIQA